MRVLLEFILTQEISVSSNGCVNLLQRAKGTINAEEEHKSLHCLVYLFCKTNFLEVSTDVKFIIMHAIYVKINKCSSKLDVGCPIHLICFCNFSF